MLKPGSSSSFIAEAPILARRVVKAGSSTGQVVQSIAAADDHLGISDLGQDSAGARVDVIVTGWAEAQAGGAIAMGARLTADAQGRVIASTVGVGKIIGTALEAAAQAGEIIQINVAPGR